MFGMKDDEMRAMRMKAKSKYLDDLLADNSGKMAIEIKKVYSPAEGMKTKEIEVSGGEEEENGEENGLSPDMSKMVQGAGDVAEELAKKSMAKPPMGEEEKELSSEEIMKLLKQLDIAKLM